MELSGKVWDWSILNRIWTSSRLKIYIHTHGIEKFLWVLKWVEKILDLHCLYQSNIIRNAPYREVNMLLLYRSNNPWTLNHQVFRLTSPAEKLIIRYKLASVENGVGKRTCVALHLHRKMLPHRAFGFLLQLELGPAQLPRTLKLAHLSFKVLLLHQVVCIPVVSSITYEMDQCGRVANLSSTWRVKSTNRKFCLSICPSSLQILFLFLIQTLSSGESRNLSHGIQCPPPCLPCPPPSQLVPKLTGSSCRPF